MPTTDPNELEAAGLPQKQAIALAAMIDDPHHAPSAQKLYEAGFSGFHAMELATQIGFGNGSASPLVQMGMDLSLATKIAETINANSPWRPRDMRKAG